MAETSFKVIWIAQCPDKLVAFVFSSVTGQWRATASPCWGDLSPAFSRPACRSLLRRSYAYGCFYWMMGDSGNLLAGEGKIGMFAFCNCIDIYALELYSTTMQNEGRVASKWSFESAILMPSRDGFRVLGVTGKELCLQVSPICVSGCYLLEFSTNPSCKKLEFVRRVIRGVRTSLPFMTFKLEWFCGTTYAIISPDMWLICTQLRLRLRHALVGLRRFELQGWLAMPPSLAAGAVPAGGGGGGGGAGCATIQMFNSSADCNADQFVNQLGITILHGATQDKA
uniref:Uncharacterized protein n=1 Tax=Oryza glumipatula TaxID=40148 RepID=A0A0E0AL93_9ORYZ